LTVSPSACFIHDAERSRAVVALDGRHGRTRRGRLLMFAKVFAMLWQGSMVGKPDAQLVFVYMLAHADRDGIIDQTPEVIAALTGLEVERVRAAIEMLEAPDPRSRSTALEGRRLTRVSGSRDWGWHIVNHAHYRALRDEEQRREQSRRSTQRWRQGRSPVTTGDDSRVTEGHIGHGEPIADVRLQTTEAESNRTTSKADCSYEREPNGKAPHLPGLDPETLGTGLVSTPDPVGPAGATSDVPAGELVSLPLKDGTEWQASRAQLEEWRKLYPAVDVEQALRSMRGWCLSKARNRKTRDGIVAFVTNWLNGDQNRDPHRYPHRFSGHREASDESYMKRNGLKS
jgi:hypothetical protein